MGKTSLSYKLKQEIRTWPSHQQQSCFNFHNIWVRSCSFSNDASPCSASCTFENAHYNIWHLKINDTQKWEQWNAPLLQPQRQSLEMRKWDMIPLKARNLNNTCFFFLWCQQLLSLNLAWIDHPWWEKLKHVSWWIMCAFNAIAESLLPSSGRQTGQLKTSKWWQENSSFLSLFGKRKL